MLSNRDEVSKIVKVLFDLLSDEEKKAGSKSEAKSDLQRQESMAEKIFKEMDKDDDGKVTMDEFLTAVSKPDSVSKVLNTKLSDLMSIKFGPK